MRKHNLLAGDVDLQKLASVTKNYTGAEIEAVCRSATSFAIFKVDAQTPGAPSSVASGIKVDKKKTGFIEHQVFMRDFEKALEEIKPAFGMDNSGLENKLVGGFIDYGKSFTDIYGRCNDFINEIRHSENTQLLTLLIDGKSRCGKTALAAKLALESDFPFVKLITPENFVGVNEYVKIQKIVKIFEDAYKSNLSLTAKST